MQTLIDSIAIHATAQTNVDAAHIPTVVEPQPSTIILQPNGPLTAANCLTFQPMLEAAIDQVAEAVIVDLLWVESTDAMGIAVLVAGIERAASLGKSLSFQSMTASLRSAVDSEWDRQRELSFGSRSSLFHGEFEQFLDDWAQAS